MLKIRGKPILQNILDVLRENGVNDISVIRGYKKEKIIFPELTYFENIDFGNTNILHSLICAREKLEEAKNEKEDVIISYSDIWYGSSVVNKLKISKEHISAVVDIDWQDYYEGRTDHPVDEAENVIFDDNQKIMKIGKHIFTHETPKNRQGEFIGLWKFTYKGIEIFLKHFDRLNLKLQKLDSFQNTKEWQKAYITDIFQELIDENEEIHCTIIQGNWKEFDTVQDFDKANGRGK